MSFEVIVNIPRTNAACSFPSGDETNRKIIMQSLVDEKITSACQSSVRIRIHEEFHVKQISYLREVKNKNSLKQHDICGVYRCYLILNPETNKIILSCKHISTLRYTFVSKFCLQNTFYAISSNNTK